MKNTTATFLIALSLGLFFTFTKPYYEGVKAVAPSAAEYREALDNISNIIETRDRLLINYNSIPKVELERLEKALPKDVDTVRLAHELDSIGARYGISLKSLSIDTETQKQVSQVVLPDGKGLYEKALVSMSFVSNYKSFRSFLADLEKSLRIMNIKSLKFEVGEGGLYEHKILIETYWVK